MEKKRQILNNYINIWNQPTEESMRQKLSGCAAIDVRYCDPFTDEITGIEALAQVMGNVGRSFPGVTHELIGKARLHHNVAYYNWLARLSSGQEIQGSDYIEFGSDDLITRVVSFTDPADWQ